MIKSKMYGPFFFAEPIVTGFVYLYLPPMLEYFLEPKLLYFFTSFKKGSKMALFAQVLWRFVDEIFLKEILIFGKYLNT